MTYQFPSAHSAKYQVKGKLMTANSVNIFAYWQGNEMTLKKADGTVIMEDDQPFNEYLEILDVEIEDAAAPQDMTVLVGMEVTEKLGYNDLDDYQGLQQHPAPDPAVNNTKTTYKVERRVITDYLNIS